MLAGEADDEDTGKVQTIGARYAHGEITLEQAAEAGCHACASPGGGCQFLGTAATSQVVGEALGLDACRTRRSRRPVNRSGSTWPAGRRRRCSSMSNRGIRTTKHILTEAAFKNAMAVFAAFGGSTNLLLHTPGGRLPRRCQAAHHRRLDALQPPGAAAGRCAAERPDRPPDDAGVPRRRRAGGDAAPARTRPARTRRAHGVSGETLGDVLDWWATSERRSRLRELLRTSDRSTPTRSSCRRNAARKRGLTSTVTFPRGNLCPGRVASSNRPPSTRRWWTRTACTASSARRRCSPPRRPRSRRSRARATEARWCPATCWCCAAAGRWAAGWRRRTR